MKRVFTFSNDRTREKLSRHFRKAALLCGVFILLILVAGKVWSVKPDPQLPGGHLKITEVLLDTPGSGQVTINGVGFPLSSDPEPDVTLGDFGSLNVTFHTDTQIIADLPSPLPAGDYLLSVTFTGDIGQSKGDEYDLTVSIEPGTIGIFNDTVCPPGWTAVTDAEGRAIVGLPSGGTIGGTVGTALTDQEDRTHDHSISADGSHTHFVDIADTTSGNNSAAKTVDDVIESGSTSVADDPHTHQVDPISTATTTSSPTTHDHTGMTGTAATSEVITYIQFLVCEKV